MARQTQTVAFPLGPLEGFMYRDSRGTDLYLSASGTLASDGKRLFVIPRGARGRRIDQPNASSFLKDLARYFSDGGPSKSYRLQPSGRGKRLGQLTGIVYTHGQTGVLYKHFFRTEPVLTKYNGNQPPLFWITGGRFRVGPFGIEG